MNHVVVGAPLLLALGRPIHHGLQPAFDLLTDRNYLRDARHRRRLSDALQDAERRCRGAEGHVEQVPDGLNDTLQDTFAFEDRRFARFLQHRRDKQANALVLTVESALVPLHAGNEFRGDGLEGHDHLAPPLLGTWRSVWRRQARSPAGH